MKCAIHDCNLEAVFDHLWISVSPANPTCGKSAIMIKVSYCKKHNYMKDESIEEAGKYLFNQIPNNLPELTEITIH